MESNKYQDLEINLEHTTDEKEKIDILSEMALEIRNDDAGKSFVLAEEIIKRAKAIDYQRGLANGLNHKGAGYWMMGEYEDGLFSLKEANKIAVKIGDKSLEAKTLNNFGRIYRDLGDLAKALQNFESALEINESLEDEINQTINLTNISNLYYDLSDYDTALEYALKCLPIFKKHNDIVRLTSINNTLGNIYFRKEMYDTALKYFLQNYNYSDDNTAARSLANSGIGKVYFKMQDFEKAKGYLLMAQTQAQIVNSVEAEINAEFFLACLYMEQESYRKALDSFKKSYELAEEFMRRHDLMSVHEMLSILYDKMGDIPKAFYHLKAFENLKEEIFQQATLNKLRNLQVKAQIEVAKKEKEVAQRTAALKQQFMANMSHEIRTPMNAIVGITRLLLLKEPQPNQLKYLKAIQQSADNLLVIINDILDLSKIEAGKIEIEQIDFSVRDLISSVQEMMTLKAEEKNLQFETHIDEQIPDRIVGDPTRLNQILINLIGNAVKFTDKGSVTLSCNELELQDKFLKLIFSVSDTGIGISKEYVSRIFESFTQAGTDTARKYGGTGLGLTISKQLVDLMKGEISVESELGVGTTFKVEIPFTIAENSGSATELKMVSDKDLDKLKNAHILLAEDNEFNQLVAEDTLKDLLPGISIDIAVNGKEAVDKLNTKDYDLILMDIQMPIMDGIEATRYIRKQMPAPKNETKIIAMTANVLQDDVLHYFNEGMNAYVSKPFQTDELLLKMSAVINNITQKPEEKINTEGSTKIEKVFYLPPKVTEMNFLTQFTGGNSDKKKKYIHMFLENAPRLLNEIKSALKEDDYESVKIAAHSLKPQMSYMGIKEEVSNILLIEQSASKQVHLENIKDLVSHLEKVCVKAFDELSAYSESLTN